jgi:transcriptional regulator with XRE-family HTH domain
VFYDVFTSLCEKKGVTPNKALTDCGISRTSPAKWREGATPRGVTLQKLADYFGVTTDYLLTGEDTKKAPGLTEKDRRDVAKLVENIMSDMEQAGDLNFDGMPMSEEARAAMASAMRIGLEEARRRNKETYTPKKYRKG